MENLYNAAERSRRLIGEREAFVAAVIGHNDDDALSNILAILIYGQVQPNSLSWKRFEDLCRQPAEQRKFFDGALPFTKQQVRRLASHRRKNGSPSLIGTIGTKPAAVTFSLPRTPKG